MTTFLKLLFSVLLGSSIAWQAGLVLHAEDWPTFLHDNQRSGVTGESLRPPLALQWVFESPFPPAPGWSLPVNGYGARKNKPNVSYDDAFRVIAVGDRCYFCSSAENRVVAVDAATGAVKWERFTDAPPRLAPAYWQGKIYVGADDGVFRCFHADSGELLWQVHAAPRPDLMLGHGRFSSVWPIRAAGIVDDGVAYFTAGLFPYDHLFFYAVNAEDGTVIWRRQLDAGGRGAHAPQGHILATDDSLFTTSRIAPSRWNKEDGRPLDFSTPFPSVPDAHEYRFYNGGSYAQVWQGKHLVYGRACILAYDPDVVLKDKWGKPHKGQLLFNWFNARQILFREDLAFVATDDHVLAVRQDRLADLAEHECREFEAAYKRLRIASYLDVVERHAQLVDTHGADHPEVKQLADGPLKWGRENWLKWPEVSAEIFARMRRRCEWMTSSNATEAFVLAGSTIYAGSDEAVYALDAATGKVVWQFTTASRVRGLAVANGRLYVSTVDGRVRCFARALECDDLSSPSVSKESAGRIIGPLATTVEKESGDKSPHSMGVRPHRTHATVLSAAKQVHRGYCLILGSRDCRLAGEIAAVTDLRIEVCVSEKGQVPKMRRALAAASLYGGRVTVRHVSGPRLPYAPHLFNLVVDEGSLTEGEPSFPEEERFRVTKPCGGVALLGWPGEANGEGADSPASAPVPAGLRWLNVAGEAADGLLKITRGPLPAARDWTHNYANAANTYCSDDPLVKGPFGVLWYGEPGPRLRIDRHATPPMPLVVCGIVYTIGNDVIMAYDAYNGVQYWQRKIAGASRSHLPINTSNLAADHESLFVVVDSQRCLRLEGRSGKTLQEYRGPAGEEPERNGWAWIALSDGRLYGSRPEWDERRRRPHEQTSDAVFCLDQDTGQNVWTYQAAGIDHDGIAIDQDRLFLIDRKLTDAERRQALAGTVRDSTVPDRDPVDRRGDPIPPDLRKLVVLDAPTGRLLWQQPLNVTDITLDDTIVQGRAGVACMVKDGVLIVHGTGSLGHPHREFLAGKFARRALYAFDAATGRFLWGGRKGYRKRPIIVGDYVYAEPFAWQLKTGQLKTVPNPLSGRPQAFDFHRGYIGCGHVLASESALFGARGGIGYCNLDEQRGFTPFAGMALACGICATPAGGVFVVPEGRSGCTCDTPIHTSVALYPKHDGGDWGIGFAGERAETASLPVKHACVNLGAPGYRDDSEGNLWIPYPARIDAGPLGPWLPTYQHHESMCYRLDDLHTEIAGTDIPWVFTSGYAHDKPLVFRMLADDQPPAKYTVKLYFAEPEEIEPGRRRFSVFLQGQPVLEDFDICRAAGGPRRAVVKTFQAVKVQRDLEIALRPMEGAAINKPILCGIEAVRE